MRAVFGVIGRPFTMAWPSSDLSIPLSSSASGIVTMTWGRSPP